MLNLILESLRSFRRARGVNTPDGEYDITRYRERRKTLARRRRQNVRACVRKWSACALIFRSIRELHGPYAYVYCAKSPIWALASNNSPRSRGRVPHIMGER